MRYTIFFDTINNLDNFIYAHVKDHYISQRSAYKNNSCVVMTEMNHPKKSMVAKAKQAKGYVSNT